MTFGLIPKLVWNTDWLMRLSSMTEFSLGDLFVNRQTSGWFNRQTSGWLSRIEEKGHYKYHIRWTSDIGQEYITTHSHSGLENLVTKLNIDYYPVKKPLGK